MSDRIGGLVGNGTAAPSPKALPQATLDGGDGDDDLVGGLVGINTGTITASSATGDADGGDGDG